MSGDGPWWAVLPPPQWPLTPMYTITPVRCEKHCHCIDVKPEGERTTPHVKCCKCGDMLQGRTY